MKRDSRLTKVLPAVVILAAVAACGGEAGPMPPTQTPPPPPPPPPPPVAPVQVGTIPNQSVETGQTTTLDVVSYFRDPDGGALTYTAESSAPAVVSVSLSGSTLTLTSVADGTATVTVTATDPDGLTATQGFEVTVETPNRAPEAVGTIPGQSLDPGRTATVDVSSYFQDPDGDALAYTAASSAPAVVSVSMSASTLAMAGVADGSGTVTVTARDPDGLTAEQRFNVTVGGGGGDDHSCVPGRETTLAWADSVGGVLTPGDEDCFTVDVPAAATAGRLTAWTTGDTDTYGLLYDSSYDGIDENDDGFYSTNFYVRHDPASPGRYYIRVRGYDSDESGPYTIHVDDHGSSTDSATGEWLPVTFDAEANTGSIAAPGNRDFFAFYLFDDALIGVGTTGGTDTYGTLYDDTGARVAEDNDSGPGRNFRIERPLTPGDYFIEVQGFGNSTGSYELVVGPVAVRHSAYPTWSPDGSRIAFTSDRDGSVDIYAMNADGSGVTRLTNDRAWDLTPAWSPDGSRIAHVSNADAFTRRDGDLFFNFKIHVMNADGSGVTRLTDSEATDVSPAWSPDGSRIAFASDRDASDLRDDDLFGTQIYVMNADGSGVTRLTGVSEASDIFPAWSPDGSRIAFASDRDDSERVNSDIYVMSADGSGVTRLTGGVAGETITPAWSPDGSTIAFTSDRDGGDRSNIYVMNADGSGVTRLTGSESDDGFPAWSPDGSRIAFMSDRDGNFEIYVMNADGSGVTRLTTTSAEGDAADGRFSEWLRSGSGPALRSAPDRIHGIPSADGAAPGGRDALLGPVSKQPVLKTKPQRRGGRRR